LEKGSYYFCGVLGTKDPKLNSELLLIEFSLLFDCFALLKDCIKLSNWFEERPMLLGGWEMLIELSRSDKASGLD
jgi:hypothetical protein